MTDPTTKQPPTASSSSSSSLDALASGLKRSIAPSMRTLDGAVATARWMQKDCVDAIDRCASTTETLLKDTTTCDVLRRRTKEDDEDCVDERLANVLDRVSGLSERYQTVLERTRRQKTMLLENARRCDVDVVRANEGDECDFQAVLKTEAYVKR
jgi:hypothetical protein